MTGHPFARVARRIYACFQKSPLGRHGLRVTGHGSLLLLYLAAAMFLQSTHAAQEAPATGAQAPGPAANKVVDDARDLIGTRYRRGGENAETGFDCSGFVGYVFRQALGLVLPRTSRDISKSGEPVAKTDLEPGDLVFFNTLRNAFSHVGIYLGDHLFVHAPRSGEKVRIEDMRERYWAKRYNGARRVSEGRD